jgi:hypothetical protein
MEVVCLAGLAGHPKGRGQGQGLCSAVQRETARR